MSELALSNVSPQDACLRIALLGYRSNPYSGGQGVLTVPGETSPWPIGITSGASTPEDLVDAVIEKLEPVKVTWLDGPSEDFEFKLPEEVRHVVK